GAPTPRARPIVRNGKWGVQREAWTPSGWRRPSLFSNSRAHWKAIRRSRRRSVADGEEGSVVLRIDLALRPQRKGGIAGSERLVEEDLAVEGAALRDLVQVSVFAVGKHVAGSVNGRRVDAPLEAVAVRRVDAAVLELPFDVHAGTQLRDVIRARRGR